MLDSDYLGLNPCFTTYRKYACEQIPQPPPHLPHQPQASPLWTEVITAPTSENLHGNGLAISKCQLLLILSLLICDTCQGIILLSATEVKLHDLLSHHMLWPSAIDFLQKWQVEADQLGRLLPTGGAWLAAHSTGCTFSRHFSLFLFMPLLNGEHSGTESRPAIRFLPEKGRCPRRPAAHCLSIGTLILMMGPREQRGSSTAQPTAGGAEAGGWKGAYGLPRSRTKGQRDIQVSWALCINSAIFLEPWPLEKHG